MAMLEERSHIPKTVADRQREADARRAELAKESAENRRILDAERIARRKRNRMKRHAAKKEEKARANLAAREAAEALKREEAIQSMRVRQKAHRDANMQAWEQRFKNETCPTCPWLRNTGGSTHTCGAVICTRFHGWTADKIAEGKVELV